MVDDAALQARTQNVIASQHWMEFENEEAVEAAFLAVRHAKHDSDKKQYAKALATIGLICHDYNDAPRALGYLEQARNVEQERADTAAVAALTSHTASAYLQNNQFEEAEKTYRTALSMVDDSAQSPQVAGMYCNIAIALQRSGDLQRAQENYSRSLQLHQFNNFGPGIAGMSSNMAELELERGDVAAAIRYYEIAEALFNTMQARESLSRVQWEIARHRISSAPHPATQQQLDALQICCQRCEDAGVVDTTVNRAYSDILAKHGRSHDAQTYANLAEQASEQQADEQERASQQQFQSTMVELEALHTEYLS